MRKIYVDATCEHWAKTKGKALGRIVGFCGRKKIFDEEFEIKHPSLRQFINRFELEAIKRALNKFSGENGIIVYSDSQVAVRWSGSPLVRWISREKNLAGRYLEKEKERAWITKID